MLYDLVVQMVISSRSSVTSSLHALRARIRLLAEQCGATVSENEIYPGWNPAPQSDLVTRVKQIYTEQFELKPQLTAIHAGLEVRCNVCEAIQHRKPPHQLSARRLLVSLSTSLFSIQLQMLRVLSGPRARQRVGTAVTALACGAVWHLECAPGRRHGHGFVWPNHSRRAFTGRARRCGHRVIVLGPDAGTHAQLGRGAMMAVALWSPISVCERGV